MNYLLVVIGTLLFVLSVALILIGSFYRKRTCSEAGTEFTRSGRDRYTFIPMRFQFDVEVKGEIYVTKGELQFSLENYFAWNPYETVRQMSPAHFLWSGNGKQNFKRKLKAGDYMFVLKTKAEEVKAKLEYSVTYYIPKLKQLVDLGLAFVEVSVPLLVTGLII